MSIKTFICTAAGIAASRQAAFWLPSVERLNEAAALQNTILPGGR